MWWLQQVFAVFLKKVHTAKRDRRFIFVGLIFPLVATIGVIIIKEQFSKISVDSSYLPITLPFGTFGTGISTTIPYIASPGVDPNPLFQHFPEEFNFTQFDSVDTLNSLLLNNQSIYYDIIGGYNFLNINKTTNTFSVSIWFNDSYDHVLPALTKTLAQAIYSYQNNATLDLQETAVSLGSGLPVGVDMGFIAPTILQYGIMFLLPYFAIGLVIEKEKKLKEMLILNSLYRPAYWIGTFLGDTILYWVPNIISLILLWSFKITMFGGSNAGSALLIVLLTGWAGIPFVYLMSFLFAKEETANRWIYSAIGILSAVPTTLSAIVKPSNTGLNFLAFIPPFGYYRGLVAMANGLSIAVPCLILFLDGILFWLIVLLIDFEVFAHLTRHKYPPPFTRDESKEDEDVVRERELVLNNGPQPEDAVRVKQVVKSYNRSFVAVKGVTFKVKTGECFGLLGPNGAGKTSILGVMYKATHADAGDVTVTLSGKGGRHVQGVCPQFDHLWDLMTGREHLAVFARIKGLTGPEIESAIAEALDLFGLTEFADQKTSGYSGGTKRKLCSAIALMANPQVVFMDEPSTGMDPVTRRLLWNVIEQKKHGRALILTTHSMEEAEALCTRVGIMVMGQLRCIGSPQHLRNVYGSGYRLTINTTPENSENVQRYVNEHYRAKSQMAVGGVLNFDIQNENVELHKIFQEMEQARHELGISDYCLSQTSLEQVFLRFALEQEDEMDQQKNTPEPKVLISSPI